MSTGSTVFLKDSFKLEKGDKSITTSNDVVSSVGKENLIKNSQFKNGFSGWTLGIGSGITGNYETVDNRIRLNMTNSTSASDLTVKYWNPTSYSLDAKARKLTLSVKTEYLSENIRATIRILTNKGQVLKAVEGLGVTTVTKDLVDGEVFDHLWISIYPKTIGNTGYAIFSEPKIEEGEMTPYSASPSEIQPDTPNPTIYKTNILLSEPLRSVGDVKDRLFLDADGLWKVERNVGERVFDGTEGWGTYASQQTYTYNLYEAKIGYQTSTCSHFKNKSGSWNLASSGHGEYSDHTTVALRYFNFNGTLAEFKAWLVVQKSQGKPVTIQFHLNTSTTEILSAEQQTKLNNIQSFKGSNYVYTIAGVVPNLNAQFKSNMWYRMNVLGEKQVSGNRNWVTNGNLAYPLEKSLWSSYYKGTVREVVDISAEAPPFKNALHIKQTTNGVAGIIDAVIWEGAEANVLSGQNISMATWIKYQNISNESLVMQVQVTGKTSSGLFSYAYPKVFSYTGTDLTWKRQTGTVKINLPDGAVEITRVAFRLGLAGAGTGEFWATGIQLETGNALGDWSTNPNDTEEELNKTEARFILTEKEIGLTVKKGELINGVLVNGDGVKIDGRNVDITGLVTFGSFDTTTKNAIDAKSTKAEAQGYADSAVNNLEIGGRNLVIRNGEWSNRYLVGAETYPNPSSSDGQKSSTMKELISVTAGENITFTKSSPSSDDYWRVSWLNSSKVYVSRFANISNKFMMTVPNGVAYMWVSFPTDSNPKIERGTKATDWTPAPEDVDAMIAQAQTDATSAKTKTDDWTFTGTTTIDGGKIKADTITSAQIKTGSLNADDITSGTLKGGAFNLNLSTGKMEIKGTKQTVKIDSGGLTLLNNQNQEVGGLITAYSGSDPTVDNGLLIAVRYGKPFTIGRQSVEGGTSYNDIIKIPYNANSVEFYEQINLRGNNIAGGEEIEANRFRLKGTNQYLVSSSGGGGSFIDTQKVSLGIGTSSAWVNRLSVGGSSEDPWVDIRARLNMQDYDIGNANGITAKDIKATNRLIIETGTKKGVLYHGSSSMIVSAEYGITISHKDAGGIDNPVMKFTKGNVLSWATLDMNGNSITNQSDRRLKKNINKTIENSLSSITEWNFVNYEWIDSEKPDGVKLGLIAQDTPELMIYDAESDIYSIDSSKQTMMNSHAIQQLNMNLSKEIELLKIEIFNLKDNK